MGPRDDYQELRLLPHDGRTVRASELFRDRRIDATAVLIELDDLLGYLEAHKTLTGIQRVEVGIIRHALELAGAGHQRPYAFVLNELGADCLWLVRASDLQTLVDYVTSANVDHDRLKQMVKTLRANATGLMPSRGQIYIILGAFWVYGAVAPRYVFVRQAGVVVVAYIYDIIPITHTQFCDGELPHEFSLSFADGLRVFDALLTISDYTATEVRRYIARHGLRDKPIQTVPLAHSCTDVVNAPSGVWSESIRFLRDRPFVLMVSTIEARKNHIYLVTAWKQFLDEGLDPPDLVFVGRLGWQVTSLIEMLKMTRFLDNRVHILHGLSDAALETLYDACLFTAFPSMVEGWGLPVGESLARGKPCVASSTSSVPEVGGDLVDYLDPLDLRDGIEVLRHMAFDTHYRERRTAEIRSRFKARTWPEVAANLLQQTDRLCRDIVIDTSYYVLLPIGTAFTPGDLALGNKLPTDYPVYPYRSMLLDGWHGIDKIGALLRGNQGTIGFRSELEAGSEIDVYLGLYCSESAVTGSRVTATVGAHTVTGTADRHAGSVVVPVGAHFSLRAAGRVDQAGNVTVHVTLSRAARAHGEDWRTSTLGLTAIGHAPAGELAGKGGSSGKHAPSQSAGRRRERTSPPRRRSDRLANREFNRLGQALSWRSRPNRPPAHPARPHSVPSPAPPQAPSAARRCASRAPASCPAGSSGWAPAATASRAQPGPAGTPPPASTPASSALHIRPPQPRHESRRVPEVRTDPNLRHRDLHPRKLRITEQRPQEHPRQHMPYLLPHPQLPLRRSLRPGGGGAPLRHAAPFMSSCGLRASTRHHLHLEALHHVALAAGRCIPGKAQPAFIPARHLPHIVLEPLQLAQLTVMDDNAIPQQPNPGPTLHQALGDHAARHLARSW